MRSIARSFVCAALCALGGAAYATDFAPSPDLVKALTPDGVLVQAGRASDTTTLTLGLQWDWSRTWQIGERGRLSGYSEVSLGHWNADDDGGSAVVTQIGFTPTLRYWHGGVMTGWFYEAGIGVNLLTPLYRTSEKRFSTAFNFGDHLAIGYRLGAPSGWEWSLRVQHFSNAGIDHPNPGENFVQLRLVIPVGIR